MTHPCPRCGNSTDGSWSEGGLKWAICDNCMNEERSRIAQDNYRAVDYRISMGLSEDPYDE